MLSRYALVDAVGLHMLSRYALVDAPDPHGMVPTSTPDINKKVHGNIHMLWMRSWVNHHATTNKLVGPEFRI